MENKHQLLRRLLALLVMLLLCAGLAGSRLVDLQLVHGQEYLERSAQFLTTTSTVSAARRWIRPPGLTKSMTKPMREQGLFSRIPRGRSRESAWGLAAKMQANSRITAE